MNTEADIDYELNNAVYSPHGEFLMEDLYIMKSRFNVKEKVRTSIDVLEKKWGTVAPIELRELCENVTRSVARNGYWGDRNCYDKFMSYDWNNETVTFMKSIRNDEIVYRDYGGCGVWYNDMPIMHIKTWKDIMTMEDRLKYGVIYALAYNFFHCQCMKSCYGCGYPDDDDVEYAAHCRFEPDSDCE